MLRLAGGSAALLASLALPAALADDALPQISPQVPLAPLADRWYLQTSAVTLHFDPQPHHNNNQRLLNLEWRAARRWVAGAAVFDNSFGQASQYIYGGLLWRPIDTLPGLHIKLTAGLLHGYKGEHRDKIPLNDLGIAPAVLPALGYSGKRLGTELVLYGTAGVMWNVGIFLK